MARAARAHCDEFFGGGRVDRQVASKSALVAHLDRDGGDLDHLARLLAEDMDAEHTVVAPSTTSFMIIRSRPPDNVAFIGRNTTR